MAVGCRPVITLVEGVPPRFQDECRETATRRLLLDDVQIDVCLWHSLVAVEHLGARWVRELLRT